MKILLPIDGSPCSKAAVREVVRREWPSKTTVKVLSVAHAFPLIPEPTLVLAAAHHESLEEQRAVATRLVEDVADEIRDEVQGLRVVSEVLDGSPKRRIVEAAEEWGADLIILGCHGFGPVRRFLVGSVAQAVVVHAPCSVQIARDHGAHLARERSARRGGKANPSRSRSAARR